MFCLKKNSCFYIDVYKRQLLIQKKTLSLVSFQAIKKQWCDPDSCHLEKPEIKGSPIQTAIKIRRNLHRESYDNRPLGECLCSLFSFPENLNSGSIEDAFYGKKAVIFRLFFAKINGRLKTQAVSSLEISKKQLNSAGLNLMKQSEKDSNGVKWITVYVLHTLQ